ncbi:MAG TPA: gluconeogenesis factor YvcK family protein [Actinomycetota bacterium]
MKVVGIGGGHGLASSLQAARLYSDEVAAVVTVADDGGSSGRLTRELGIPPPGDIRNCLVALSDNTELSELWQHRFTSGALTGHTVGNLVIAALTERAGDFAEAVEAAGRLLSVKGHVYPATTDRVALRARVDGGVVKGQVAVAQTRSPIQAVYLKPADPRAHEPAVEAIRAADQVVLGPGSLFTSLIATLLVPGIRQALVETSARRVFVCNSRMQKGETEGLSAAAHVEALMAHVGPFSVDAVVVQDPVVAEDGVVVDSDALEFLNFDVIRADVARADGGHVPERLAEALSPLT